MNRRSSFLPALWFAAFLMAAACSSGTTPVDAAANTGAPPGGQNAATGTGGVVDAGATGGRGGRGALGGRNGFGFAGFGGIGIGIAGFPGFGTGGVTACAGPGASCDTLLCCDSLHCCSTAAIRTCSAACAVSNSSPAGF